MINFRYHLVSLVSVFFALAVGIVLGAGPLSGPIESSFEDQITQLRQDKDGLREELEQSQTNLAFAQDGFVQLWPQLLPGRLAGHQIGVVTVGLDPSERLEALRLGLTQAGAQLGGVWHIEAKSFSLLDPGTTGALEQLAALGLTPVDSPAELVISAALSYALTGGGPVEPAGQAGLHPDAGSSEASGQHTAEPPASPDQLANSPEPPDQYQLDQPADLAAEVYQQLKSGGYISGDNQPRQLEAVVFLVGHLERPDVELTAEQADSRKLVVSSLLESCARRGLPVVISGPSDQAGDLVALMQAVDLVGQVQVAPTITGLVSVLDIPVNGAEVIGLVWALADAFDGLSGSWGLAGPLGMALPPPPGSDQLSLTPSQPPSPVAEPTTGLPSPAEPVIEQ